MAQAPFIIWLKNDLRLHDNPLLQKGLDSNKPLIVLYVWEDEWNEPMPSYGFPKMGDHRKNFLIDSLSNLKENIEAIGGALTFRIGKAQEIIPEMAREFNCDTVLCSTEVNPEEIERLEAVNAALPAHCTLQTVWSNTLFHPNDLPFGKDELPFGFTSFRKKAEKRARVIEPFEAPTALETFVVTSDALPEKAAIPAETRTAFPCSGGEDDALARVENYIWETENLATYKETRNGLVGLDYSSKLSPWLANGSLSARYVAEEIQRFEDEVTKNQSTYWLLFELMWRDFFRLNAWKHGSAIFKEKGIKDELPHKWGYNQKAFAQWQEGNTPEDFVNANMLELAKTGWMSNRGRQNVASYLVHDMGIDWRWGAAWFESQLLDYDPSSNYGNWTYIAGVGNDSQAYRKFNIERQQGMYDKKAAYRKLWLNEVAEGV